MEGGDVLITAGGHRCPQRTHQVERTVVLAGRTEQDLVECSVLVGLDPSPTGQRGVEGRHTPVIAPARRLSGTGKRRTNHDGVGAAGDSLGDIAAGSHAAIGDHVAVLARLDHVLHPRARRVGDRRRLRHAHADHLAGGAGGARPDAHEHAHGTGAHEVQAGRVGRAAAEDARDLDVGDELVEVQGFGRR